MAQIENENIGITNYTKNLNVLNSECKACKVGIYSMKTLEIHLPNEKPALLSTSSCSNCDVRGYEIVPMDRIENRLKITANIKSKDDLYRYISLSKDASFEIKSNTSDFSYSYDSITDTITCIENLLIRAIDEFGQYYGFEEFNYSTTSEHNLYTQSDINISVRGENQEQREEVRTSLNNIRKELADPNFTIIVIDDSGSSRVFPQKKLPNEINIDEPVETFNDEHVKHEFL